MSRVQVTIRFVVSKEITIIVILLAIFVLKFTLAARPKRIINATLRDTALRQAALRHVALLHTTPSIFASPSAKHPAHFSLESVFVMRQ